MKRHINLDHEGLKKPEENPLPKFDKEKYSFEFEDIKKEIKEERTDD